MFLSLVKVQSPKKDMLIFFPKSWVTLKHLKKVCACFEECAKFPSDLNNSASQRKHREWERQGPPASSNIFENKDKIVFPIVQYSMCDNFRHLQHLAFAIDSTSSFADYLKSQFIIWWAGLMRDAVTIALSYNQVCKPYPKSITF